MAQAIFERDTFAAAVIVAETRGIMRGMTLMAAPEQDHEEPPRFHIAPVHWLTTPLDPTPEEVAAKKARRRLDSMDQDVDLHGLSRPHFYNEAGYDIWGRDSRGNYDPTQDTHPSTPNPFSPTSRSRTDPMSIAPDVETLLTEDADRTPAQPVTVYSKPKCVQCNATYRKLTKMGVEYEVVDVSEDEEALAHIVALGYQQVPVVETAEAHWSGYRPDKIEEHFA